LQRLRTRAARARDTRDLRPFSRASGARLSWWARAQQLSRHSPRL